MKFFVSSRMRELFFERKIVIETIHAAGHTPLYIETEPDVKDEAARNTMDKLAADADGFISLCYLSLGKKERLLGNLAPIEYELEQFIKYKKGTPAPVVFFKEEPDNFVRPSQYLLEWLNDQTSALGTAPIIFNNPHNLEDEMSKVLREYSEQLDIIRAKPKFTVRYVGPDFVGLIGKLSEVAFTGYGLNVDYISHASTGGSATTYMSCSQRTLAGEKKEIDLKRLERDMKKILTIDLSSAKEEKRLIVTSESIPPFKVDVVTDFTDPHPYQFFTIVRTIDAPGQLNAVCKELQKNGFNIDEFQLRPSPPEHPRQTTMTMWLSRKLNVKEKDDDLAELERIFRYLIGVRAFTIRVMDCPAPRWC